MRTNNISFWHKTSSKPDFPQFTESAADVPAAIIGGGLAGILTSYILSQNGIHNIVLESGNIGGGNTGSTTAKITAGHNLIYDNISNSYGDNFAYLYAKSNLNAIQSYRDIISSENIDCDFTTESNFIYSLNDVDSEKIDREFETLKRLGIPCNIETRTSLPFSVTNALKMPEQAYFHPLKFLYSISKNLNIYENSKVISLDINSNIIQTEKGALHAKSIVICTHFPFINAPGYFFLKMHQDRSYVAAIHRPSSFGGMYIDCNEKGYSFRPHKDLLLIGGSSHRCGHNEAGTAYYGLEKYIGSIFPGSEILHRWSAQDCMPLDDIPYIGHFSKKTPDIYVATGFKKWGMTTSMVAANLITDMITNIKNDYKEVYSPNRFELISSVKNILSNAKDTTLGFTSEQLNSDNPTCPHLGCKLTWNPDEESWDCPCHGSRFDKCGEILSNPAQRGLVIK